MMPLKPAGGVSQMNSRGSGVRGCCTKAAHSSWLLGKGRRNTHSIKGRKVKIKKETIVWSTFHQKLLSLLLRQNGSDVLHQIPVCVVGLQTCFYWWALICACFFVSHQPAEGVEARKEGFLLQQKRDREHPAFIHRCLNSLTCFHCDGSLLRSFFSCPYIVSTLPGVLLVFELL